MKSTQQNKIKIGFTTTSGLKAGNNSCSDGCMVVSNEAYGWSCDQCSDSPLKMQLCTGNPTCIDDQPGGDKCECL